MNQESMYCFKNQQWLNISFLSSGISVEDRAFLYGDGCFSTARVRQGTVLLLTQHLQRLAHAVYALSLNMDMQRINDAIVQALTTTSFQEGVLKILISRGYSDRGYASPKHAADLYIYLYPDHEQRIHTPSYLDRVGICPHALASHFLPLKGIKTLNRLEQIWLKQYATQHAWQEMLCHDSLTNWVEGIASNCFFYLRGIWHTPSLNLAGIHGVMRQELIIRLQQCNIAYQISDLSYNALQYVDALFFCNALHPMQIVRQCELNNVQQIRQYEVQPCLDLFSTLSLMDLM